MAIGTQMQNSGVNLTESSVDSSGAGGFKLVQLFGLFKRKRWVFGTLLLGAAIVLQLISLRLAPLMVVQPVGVLALVITTFLNARVQQVKLNRATLLAVSLSVFGIVTFVSIAAGVAEDKLVTDSKLIQVLSILGIVTVIFGILFILFGHKLRALTYIIGAGVLYGFVATLAKVVIGRIVQGDFEWLTLICAASLVTATVLGGWFVQNAHASGPPDLVMAGLTVIDPLVAVAIGVIVLQEAAGAGAVAITAFMFSAAIAIFGVILLSKHHPQLTKEP